MSGISEHCLYCRYQVALEQKHDTYNSLNQQRSVKEQVLSGVREQYKSLQNTFNTEKKRGMVWVGVPQVIQRANYSEKTNPLRACTQLHWEGSSTQAARKYSEKATPFRAHSITVRRQLRSRHTRNYSEKATPLRHSPIFAPILCTESLVTSIQNEQWMSERLTERVLIC